MLRVRLVVKAPTISTVLPVISRRVLVAVTLLPSTVQAMPVKGAVEVLDEQPASEEMARASTRARRERKECIIK
ncbi:hypothetical protein GCM10023185_34230 [Hymenobacter saemangeumensis]|uniref:Uncharacterized protein n=1 Tax=Hymenobacter saemangeumensis TaxID=1084522 RepID=A0ABP8IPG8_9BACT